MSLKNYLNKYKHILFILYLPVYMYCFMWLEKRINVHFTVIHCFIDDLIPFCEIFIIPYLLWFIYVIVIVVYLFFQTEHLHDYYRCIICLILGMSTCLLIYYLFPNMQAMRPKEFARSNVFIDMICYIYSNDTDTNVLPSIHVYNAAAVHFGFITSHRFHTKRGWKLASTALFTLICLSTMFLKQHSFLDVLTGLLLYALYASVIYIWLPKKCKNKKN